MTLRQFVTVGTVILLGLMLLELYLEPLKLYLPLGGDDAKQMMTVFVGIYLVYETFRFMSWISKIIDRGTE